MQVFYLIAGGAEVPINAHFDFAKESEDGGLTLKMGRDRLLTLTRSVSLPDRRRTNQTYIFAVATEILKAIAPDLENEIRGNFVFKGEVYSFSRPPPVYDDFWHESGI